MSVKTKEQDRNEQLIRRLAMPAGTIPATGKEVHAPCCDVFHIENGKVTSFHCYVAVPILLGQLGVLMNLGAAFRR